MDNDAETTSALMGGRISEKLLKMPMAPTYSHLSEIQSSRVESDQEKLWRGTHQTTAEDPSSGYETDRRVRPALFTRTDVLRSICEVRYSQRSYKVDANSDAHNCAF